MDPGEGSWPFTDTLLVFSTISTDDLASELVMLEPDEVRTDEGFNISIERTSSGEVRLPAAAAHVEH